MDKLDPALRRLLDEAPDEQVIPLMIRTPNGLQPEDRAVVEAAGGHVKADLPIVESFAADLSAAALRRVLPEPRFLRFHHDAPVRLLQPPF